MAEKKFKYGRWTVRVDTYRSLTEMRRELEKLPVQSYGSDYLYEGATGGHWIGVKDDAELKTLMNRGVVDAKRMNNIKALASKDGTKAKAKFAIKTRYDEEGDDLDIDDFVRKDPKCWVEYYRERKPSDIVDITIVSSAPGDIDAQYFDKAAAIVASCILKLEKKGYKTRISAFRGMIHYGKDTIYGYHVPIKTERERINYPRLMFIGTAAFVRGIGFTWVTRRFKLGNWAPLSCLDSDQMKDIVQTGTGKKDVNIVDLVKLAEMLDYGRSEEEVIAIAQDMIHYKME